MIWILSLLCINIYVTVQHPLLIDPKYFSWSPASCYPPWKEIKLHQPILKPGGCPIRCRSCFWRGLWRIAPAQGTNSTSRPEEVGTPCRPVPSVDMRRSVLPILSRGTVLISIKSLLFLFIYYDARSSYLWWESQIQHCGGQPLASPRFVRSPSDGMAAFVFRRKWRHRMIAWDPAVALLLFAGGGGSKTKEISMKNIGIKVLIRKQ